MEECLSVLWLLMFCIDTPHYIQKSRCQSVPVSMGASLYLVLAAALSTAKITLSLPQNYDDIDMSIDQPKNEKVDIR